MISTDAFSVVEDDVGGVDDGASYPGGVCNGIPIRNCNDQSQLFILTLVDDQVAFLNHCLVVKWTMKTPLGRVVTEQAE